MIAIQVAIGIVLAYVIIVNQRVLLRFGKAAATFIVFAAVAGIAVYLLSAAYEAVAPSISLNVGKILAKLGAIAVAIPMMIIWVVGGLALRTVYYLAKNRSPPEVENDNELGMWFGWAMMNSVVMMMVYSLLSFTPLYHTYDSVDAWSRANGHDDFWPMAMFVVSLLWPLIPLWFLRRRAQGRTSTVQPMQPEAYGEKESERR